MQRFDRLLDAYCAAETSDDRAEAEAALWTAFGIEASVLVADMSGFSRLPLRHGILHYLALVRRMRKASAPIFDRFGGRVVKYEADNAYAVFAEPTPAIHAALALNRDYDTMNQLTPDERDVHLCIGIDHGRLLLIPDHDLYGTPVNLASKLGEDLAGAGEVLVTQSARKRAGTMPEVRFETIEFSLAGLAFTAHRVRC